MDVLMDLETAESFYREVEREPYAKKLGLRLVDIGTGRAVVEMKLSGDSQNILGSTHGGAVFSLMDEAFQISCNSHGTIAVALSVTVTYHKPPPPEATLRAESREIHRSRKTGTYSILVTDDQGDLVASCQALAYRKQDPLPFIGVKGRKKK